MKFSLWTTICAVLFFSYSIWLKDNIFKIYYETRMEYYAFNETLKVTICASLQLFDDQCSKSSVTIPKLDEFSCENLERYPLNCLTKGFENKTPKSIIETIGECDQSLVFGSNLRLVKYYRNSHVNNDIGVEQRPVKNYSADYELTYLNNGDYCRTYVFESFVNDTENDTKIEKPKSHHQTSTLHYQFTLEKLHSPIKVYVNQHQTNFTYFNFYQSFHRYKDEEFWKRRHDEMEIWYPDYLGYRNVTEGSSDDPTKENATESTRSGWTFTKYIPMQNISVYALLLHTRVQTLSYPYESECADYFKHNRVVKGRATRSREECVAECHKAENNFYKFFYTANDEVKLESEVNSFPDCVYDCRWPNCLMDIFSAQKYTHTFDSGGDETEDIIARPISERNSPQNVTLNNKMKLQLNEWIKIIQARPVITPLLAINYVFGLLNVFLGTNLVHFNFKLIHVLIKLRSLTLGFDQKEKKRKRPISSPQNYLVGTGRWNLALAQHILGKKIRAFDSANRPRDSLSSSLREKMNDRWMSIKSVISSIRYDQLVNLNRLFCFYLLIILGVAFGGQLLEEMRRPQAIYSELFQPEYSDPISVSFCFDLRKIVLDNLDKEIKKELPNEKHRMYADETYRNASLSWHEENQIRAELKADYLNLLYSKYNFSQIDELTLSVEDLIQKAYLGFKEYAFNSTSQNRNYTRTVYDMHRLNPVVFYFEDSKCVKFFINRSDYYFVYRTESSFALFDFQVEYEKYFIEQDDQLPNHRSTKFKGWIEFQIQKIYNDSASCKRFEEYEPCKSKDGCKSQCIQANYTATYKAISVNHPIELDDSNRLLHFHNHTTSSQNERRIERCDLEFESPCMQLTYYKFKSGASPSKEVMINLSNDIHQKKAVNRFNLINLFNFFLNISSLLFNVNMPTTLDYLILFVLLIYSQLTECFRWILIKRRLISPGSRRSRKMYRLGRCVLRKFLNFLKILILFLGFWTHLSYAIRVYIFDSQPRSSSYEDRPYVFTAPNFTLCIGNEFVSYLNPSQTQSDYFSSKGKFTNRTGKELLSEFPSMSKTFAKIELKDKTLNNYVLNDEQIGELEEKGSFKDLLYVTRFFVEQSKCSTFYLDVHFSSIFFRLYDAVYPIRFEFRKFNTTFHYTMFVSDVKKFTFRDPIPLLENRDHLLYFDTTSITYDEELTSRMTVSTMIRKKSNLEPFKDQADFFEFLRFQFKNATNLTMTNIPLIESYFDLPIDNEAFEEFYKRKFSLKENEFFVEYSNSLLFRTVATSIDSNNLTRVGLIPQVLQQYIDYSNNLSLSETILYIGTVLSFWLNTCYIDLFAFFRRLIRSCNCCKRIKRIKTWNGN